MIWLYGIFMILLFAWWRVYQGTKWEVVAWIWAALTRQPRPRFQRDPSSKSLWSIFLGNVRVLEGDITMARRPFRMGVIILGGPVLAALLAWPVFGGCGALTALVVSGIGVGWLAGNPDWSVRPFWRATQGVMESRAPKWEPAIDGWWNYCEAIFGGIVGLVVAVAVAFG